MAKNAMPVSKAKTAYGLLSEIRKLILEEPKRYNQWGWLKKGRDLRQVREDLRPACGTVGCVGGWVVALKAPRTKPYTGQQRAQQVLGVTYEQGWELFDYDRAGERVEHSMSGLVAHAKRGAAHIAKFQKKYAKQLKAKKV